MTLRIKLLALLVATCSTASAQDQNVLPGTTTANISPSIALQAKNELAKAVRSTYGCNEVEVLETEHLEYDEDDEVDTEKWLISYCGQQKTVYLAKYVDPDYGRLTFEFRANL